MRGPKLDFLKQSPSILRDKSPFFFKKEELTQIEFSSPKESWKLEKTLTSWKSRKPYISHIDSIAIEQLITDISKLKITNFYPSLDNTNYASLAKNDFYTLSLSYDYNNQKNSETLKIIPVKDQNNNVPYWIIQHSQRPGYFQMKSIGSADEPGILNLSLSLADLRSKLLTQIPVADITNIEMSYTNGFTQTLSQSNNNNWLLRTAIPEKQGSIEKYSTEKPHENKLEPFLKSLLHEPVLNILSEQTELDLAVYGLNNPSLTIKIKEAESQHTLSLSQVSKLDADSASTYNYYAKWDHLNTILLCLLINGNLAKFGAFLLYKLKG